MSLMKTDFKYTPFLSLGDTESESQKTDIPDIEQCTIDLGSEGKNNTFRLTLKNPVVNIFSDGTPWHKWVGTDGQPIFKAVKVAKGSVIQEEVIDIYAYYTDTDPSVDVESDDYLLFSGIITSAGTVADSQDGGFKIELKGMDRNNIIMDKITQPIYVTAGVKSAPEIIQQVVRNNTDTVLPGSYGFTPTGSKVRFGGSYHIDARLFSSSIKSSGTANRDTLSKLIDTSATFITDGVAKDDWVRNTSTNQTAYVVSVDFESQVTLSKDIFPDGSAGYQISDGFIQDFRNDGSSFPNKPFSIYDKPVVDSIEELSTIDNINTQAEITGTIIMGRRMHWFIDKKARMHWYAPEETPEVYMEVGKTEAIAPDTTKHYIHKTDLDNEVQGKVNFIVYRAGEDMNDTMIRSYAREPYSGQAVIKDSLRNWVKIAVNLKDQALKEGEITHSAGTSYNYPASYNPLPTGSDYPVWDSIRDTIPTSDSEYNTIFIQEAKIRANLRAQSEFDKLSSARWSGQIQIRGEDLRVGDLIDFTSKRHGMSNIQLRVKQVTHTITPQTGWLTSLRVEEDEPKRET